MSKKFYERSKRVRGWLAALGLFVAPLALLKGIDTMTSSSDEASSRQKLERAGFEVGAYQGRSSLFDMAFKGRCRGSKLRDVFDVSVKGVEYTAIVCSGTTLVDEHVILFPKNDRIPPQDLPAEHQEAEAKPVTRHSIPSRAKQGRRNV